MSSHIRPSWHSQASFCVGDTHLQGGFLINFVHGSHLKLDEFLRCYLQPASHLLLFLVCYCVILCNQIEPLSFMYILLKRIVNCICETLHKTLPRSSHQSNVFKEINVLIFNYFFFCFLLETLNTLEKVYKETLLGRTSVFSSCTQLLIF